MHAIVVLSLIFVLSLMAVSRSSSLRESKTCVLVISASQTESDQTIQTEGDDLCFTSIK